MYYDPTGHWEVGDENRAEWIQDAIVLLTDAYYDENDDINKDMAQTMANYLRDMPQYGHSKESFYDKFGEAFYALEKYSNKDFYDNVSNTLEGENDYFSADEWAKASSLYVIKDTDQISAEGTSELEVIEFTINAKVDESNPLDFGAQEVEYNARIIKEEVEFLQNETDEYYNGYKFEMYNIQDGKENTIVESIVFSDNPEAIWVNIDIQSSWEADSLKDDGWSEFIIKSISHVCSEWGMQHPNPYVNGGSSVLWFLINVAEPKEEIFAGEGTSIIDVTTQFKLNGYPESIYTYPYTMRHYVNEKGVNYATELITDKRYYMSR